jgi:hypothetical protein
MGTLRPFRFFSNSTFFVYFLPFALPLIDWLLPLLFSLMSFCWKIGENAKNISLCVVGGEGGKRGREVREEREGGKRGREEM